MIHQKLFHFLKNLIFTLGLVGMVMIPVLTTSSYAVVGYSLGSVMRQAFSVWYIYIVRICISVYCVAYLIIILKLLADKTPEKIKILKESIFRFIMMFFVIYFLHYIMIGIISLNERGLDIAKSLGQTLSGIDMKTDEYDLYETVLSKAYELSAVPGFIGLIMYILLVYYTYKFAFVYAKRFINIVVLILLAPIIFVVSTIKRILMGISDGTIGKWFKEFIFNVVIQTFHALFYAMLIGLALRLSDNDENLIGVAIALIIFGFIFRIDAIIRKIFDFVGGSSKINSSKTVGRAIDTVGGAVSGGISGIGNAAETFGDNLEKKGLKDGLRQSASDAGGFFKNKIHEAGQGMKQIPSNIKQKAIATGIDIQNKTASAYASAKADVKDFKNIMNAERVKENLTKDELVVATHDLEKKDGLTGLRNKVSTAGNTFSKKTGKIGKLAKNKIVKAYATVDGRTKQAITEIQEEMRHDVETLENNVEMVRKIPKVFQKIKNYVVKKKKIKLIKNEKGMNVDITNTMMMVVDTDVSPEEFIATMREQVGEGMDVSVYTYEKIGLQTFLSPVVGVPRMGMAILAEEKYEEIAEHRIEETVTGQKRRQKKTIKKASARASKKEIKATAKSLKGHKEVFNKTYKFSRFNPDTARKINNRMLKKSREQNRYLITINKVYDDIQVDNMRARSKISKKTTEIAREVRATRKTVIRTVRQIKLSQQRAMEKYRDLEKRERRIEIAHNVGNQFMTAKSAIKLGFKQIDAMTPGQVGLRKMIKEGKAKELSSGLIAVRNTATVQEKVRATGMVKKEDQKLVLQFVVGKSGELLKQVVSTEGKIVKPAEEPPVVPTNVKKKSKKFAESETTQAIEEKPSFAMNMNQPKQEPVTEPVVQKVVTIDGKVVQQVVNPDGTIDADSYKVLDQGGEMLVAQVQSQLTNEDLGLEETATLEERVEMFETLIEDVRRAADTQPLLEQVVEQSTPEERELDEILVSTMEEIGVTSVPELKKYMHFGEDVALSEEEQHKTKMFEQAVTERMISTGIITPVEAEDKDVMAEAFRVLDKRVEVLTVSDSDILLDTAAEMERTRIAEELINKGEFTIQQPPKDEDIDAQMGKLSDLVVGLAKNYVEETIKYPRQFLRETKTYMEEVFEQAAKETKSDAQLAFESGLEKAEQKWAKKHGKDADKDIAEKYKKKEKGEDSEKTEVIKITLNFFGAVMTQGQAVSLSNRHSIKDFYNKANKLEGANLRKTQERFLQIYGDKLEAMQLMPFTFAKHPVEEMDEWCIYVVTDEEDVSQGEKVKEKKKEDTEENKAIQEIIDLYYIDIKRIFTEFIIENEILTFEQLYKEVEKKQKLVKKLRILLFRKGEKDEGSKAKAIVNYLDSDVRFKNIMKESEEDILAKAEGEERREKAKAKVKLTSKEEAEKKIAPTVTKEEEKKWKDEEKDDLMTQVLNEVVAQEEEEAQKAKSDDLRRILQEISTEDAYVTVDKGNKREQRQTLRFKTDEGDVMP